MIAGGVGITPFKGMLEFATDEPLPIEIESDLQQSRA